MFYFSIGQFRPTIKPRWTDLAPIWFKGWQTFSATPDVSQS